MCGNEPYSELKWFELRRGNVHKKALANKHATCCCVIDNERLLPRFNSGMAFGISVGNCSANRMIAGNISSKKLFSSCPSSDSKSVCNEWNRHLFVYFGLYVNIAFSKSVIDLIGCNRAVSIMSHRRFS